jgi:hypothetical protein
MPFETQDYYDVSEHQLLDEVAAGYHALKNFVLRLGGYDGAEVRENETLGDARPPIFCDEVRNLFKYAVGSRPFDDSLARFMSAAVSFSVMTNELADGFESDSCPFPSNLTQVIVQVYARYKVDNYRGVASSSLMDSIMSMFGDDDLNGLSVAELSALTKMKNQSIRNKLSSQTEISLQKNAHGKYRMKIEDAVKWLKQQLGYVETSNQVQSEDVTVSVPVARDGSFFNAALKGPNGYRIGEKGDEVVFQTFEDALESLRKMKKPYWRRPSKTTGIPGIVAGIRWEEKPKSAVFRSKE